MRGDGSRFIREHPVVLILLVAVPVCLAAGLLMSYLGGTPAGASVVMANIAALILYSLAGLIRGRMNR